MRARYASVSSRGTRVHAHAFFARSTRVRNSVRASRCERRVGAARTRVSPRRRTSSCTQQSCIVIYDGYMYKVDYIQPLVTALPVQEETGVTAALEFLYDALPVKF